MKWYEIYSQANIEKSVDHKGYIQHPEFMFLVAFGEWSRIEFSLFVALQFLVDMNASRVSHRRVLISSWH